MDDLAKRLRQAGKIPDRDRFLARNLAGYEEYRARVSARLVPGVG
jgi:hypothetical protein